MNRGQLHLTSLGPDHYKGARTIKHHAKETPGSAGWGGEALGRAWGRQMQRRNKGGGGNEEGERRTGGCVKQWIGVGVYFKSKKERERMEERRERDSKTIITEANARAKY